MSKHAERLRALASAFHADRVPNLPKHLRAAAEHTERTDETLHQIREAFGIDLNTDIVAYAHSLAGDYHQLRSTHTLYVAMEDTEREALSKQLTPRPASSYTNTLRQLADASEASGARAVALRLRAVAAHTEVLEADADALASTVERFVGATDDANTQSALKRARGRR